MKTCCFTGHRDLPAEETEKIMEAVRSYLLQLISRGVTEFRVGGAVGFDMIMAELLVKLRDEEKQPIRIISFLPYPDWRKRWSAEDYRRQNAIMKKSDEGRLL